LREAVEIFRRNFTGAIDFIGIDVFAQISFKLPEELFSSGTILGGLCRIGMDSIEIVTSDEQVAGETAAVFERIAGGLSKLERFALALGHFRCIDDGSGRAYFGLRAGFFSDLFFGRFEWRLHRMIICQIVSAGRLPACRDRQGCLSSVLIKFRPITRMLLQNFAWSKFLFSLGQPFQLVDDSL